MSTDAIIMAIIYYGIYVGGFILCIAKVMKSAQK